jgi:hypothetical protein
LYFFGICFFCRLVTQASFCLYTINRAAFVSLAKFTVFAYAAPLDNATVFLLAAADLLKMSPPSGTSFSVMFTSDNAIFQIYFPSTYLADKPFFFFL